MVEMSDRIEGFYSTPNESFRLTLYSMTLPSLTSAFCPTTSTPRMFFTVFDDLLTASLVGIFESSTRGSYELDYLSNRHSCRPCSRWGVTISRFQMRPLNLAFKKNVPVIPWVQQFRYRRLPCAQRRETLYSQAPSSTAMKLILDEEAREGAIRVDRAWELFFETKSGIPEGHGARMIPFTNWLWDELGKKAGYLNRNSGKELTLAIPAFGQEALDYLLRIASFWADEVHVKKKGGAISRNLWRKPVVNVFDDETLDGSERSLVGKDDDKYQRFFMPLLGPGRAFFRVEEISNGQSAARYHSHSEVDEYYLILDGSGTLRYHDKDVPVRRGDLIDRKSVV